MSFLITRPEHEDTVFYLSAWSKELIEQAKQNGLTTLDCHRERAVAPVVCSMLENKHPTLVMFNGHGNTHQITGHNNQVLIEKGKNERLLKAKIVYARSCSTSAELAESCIKHGTRAYIGYHEEFVFWQGNATSLRPLEDESAKPCLEASNQVVKSLLGGSTAKEAYAHSQRVSDEWLEKLQRSDAPPDAVHILPLVFWNKYVQTVHGDKNAHI